MFIPSLSIWLVDKYIVHADAITLCIYNHAKWTCDPCTCTYMYLYTHTNVMRFGCMSTDTHLITLAMASDVNLNRASFSLSFDIHPAAPSTIPLSISAICLTSWALFLMTKSWAVLSSFNFSCITATGFPLAPPPPGTPSSPEPASLSSDVSV